MIVRVCSVVGIENWSCPLGDDYYARRDVNLVPITIWLLGECDRSRFTFVLRISPGIVIEISIVVLFVIGIAKESVVLSG